jgi:hypothetical protein
VRNRDYSGDAKWGELVEDQAVSPCSPRTHGRPPRYITLNEVDPEEVEWFLNLNAVHFGEGPTTETPRVGAVEDWVYINMTGDTHQVPGVGRRDQIEWGIAQGLTEYSQKAPYADARTKLDRAAGKVLEMAF